MVADDVRIFLKVILSLEQPSKVQFWTSKLNFGHQKRRKNLQWKRSGHVLHMVCRMPATMVHR